MTTTSANAALTISATSRLVLWYQDPRAVPTFIVVPDLDTALLLRDELPTRENGSVEIMELMPWAKTADLIRAAKEMVESRKDLERITQRLAQKKDKLLAVATSGREEGEKE